MEFDKLIARAKGMLVSPQTEWEVVAEEHATTQSLYLGYIMILAAIPPIFAFIKGSLIGYSFLGVHWRVGIGAGIGGLILGWVLALIGVYVVALIINALAPTFGGQPNMMQALKTLAYAYTASWIAGFGHIIPWIGWLILIVGGLYSLYLVYLGLPHTMKCPREKSLVYMIVTVICAIIVYFIIGLIVAAITGVGMGHHHPGTITTTTYSTSHVRIDHRGPLPLAQRFHVATPGTANRVDSFKRTAPSPSPNVLAA